MLRIGIDPSLTSTGLTILSSDKPASESLNLVGCKEKVTNSKEEYLRVVLIADMIHWAYSDHYAASTDAVAAVEWASYGNNMGKASERRMLSYLIAYYLGQCDIDPLLVAPTTLKKYATGSGKADKRGMIEAVPKEDHELVNMGVKKGLDDRVDSYWLARLAGNAVRADDGPITSWTGQKYVVQGIRK